MCLMEILLINNVSIAHLRHLQKIQIINAYDKSKVVKCCEHKY